MAERARKAVRNKSAKKSKKTKEKNAAVPPCQE